MEGLNEPINTTVTESLVVETPMFNLRRRFCTDFVGCHPASRTVGSEFLHISLFAPPKPLLLATHMRCFDNVSHQFLQGGPDFIRRIQVFNTQ